MDVVVCDLDRTLTDTRLRPVPAAIRAIRRARSYGARTVLATGRTAAELRGRATLLAAFDRVVLEGGGLVGVPSDLAPVTDDAEARVRRLSGAMKERGIPRRTGVTSVSVRARDRSRLLRLPGIGRFTIQRNRVRLDVTLPGVDKGAGVRKIFASWGLSPRSVRAVAFGDGENDRPLFALARWRVAVANAVPGLAAAADEVTESPGGRGVAEFLAARLRRAARSRGRG
ncbi:MAG: HAD family hydrolase [Methanobacteriota archaeon]